MKKNLPALFFALISFLALTTAKAQCDYIPSTSTATDTLSYNFVGGGFASFGCAPIDPTYWLSGNGMSVTITFVNPQNYPSFRVWGMNSDDSASVTVNGVYYPLTSLTASYDLKTVCGLSPGPDGVLFSGGNLVGANSPVAGNYSYNNIAINSTNVNSITISGLAGGGWGFAGVTVNCTESTPEIHPPGVPELFPNPTNGSVLFQGNFSDETFVTVRNAMGQIVGNMELINNEINLEEFPAGIYFLSYEFRNQLVNKRIVKID